MGLFRFKGSSGFPGKGTFPHGIHPPENKSFSADKAVEVVPTPDKLVIPVIQNIGAPCGSIVKNKQKVAMGEMIAKGKAFVSAHLHSPVSGTVMKPVKVTLPNGRHMDAIQIKKDKGEDPGQALWDLLSSDDWSSNAMTEYAPEAISKTIQASGIVGLGGATFPTHVKLMPDKNKTIDALIVNGCECEPFLTPDYRVMMEAAGAVVAGAILAGRAVNAGRVIIAVEDNKPLAIEQLRNRTAHTQVEVAVVQTKYPQGSEKQLIKAVMNREVPLGGLPSDVGVAMSNVGTIAAVAMAVIHKKPLTHRVVSISGSGISQPKNLFVPIGMRTGDLIDYCGGMTPNAARMIAGGPMMGFAFSDPDTPVIKGTSGITILTHEDVKQEEETTCVRCGRCVDACPMNLVPTRLAMASRYHQPELAEKYNINGCFECGSCTYACPANIKLVQLIRTGKRQVAARNQ